MLFFTLSVVSLSLTKKTKSHSATKNQFSLYFITTGKLDKKYGRLLAQLFDLRQKGDYENIAEYTQEEVEPLCGQVEEMIKVIERQIENAL